MTRGGKKRRAAVALTAVATDGDTVECRVTKGGAIRERSGMNLPSVRVSSPALTDRDVDDLLALLNRLVAAAPAGA